MSCECGALWCIRGTVVCTLNSLGAPHPHSTTLGACVPVTLYTDTCPPREFVLVSLVRGRGRQTCRRKKKNKREGTTLVGKKKGEREKRREGKEKKTEGERERRRVEEDGKKG